MPGRPDVIGRWSEVKLEIVKGYANEYAKILTKKKEEGVIHHFSYIDAFAGRGAHISRDTGHLVQGSPTNALALDYSFDHYYFIDLDSEKVGALREAVGERPDVSIFEGDCNDRLLSDVFPNAKYSDYRRALCLLDPYGLHLSWDIVQTAGRMGSIELFLNFPVMDMNMNVLWHDPDNVDPEQAKRMTRYWGDESWREAAYRESGELFDEDKLLKMGNDDVAAAFRARLRDVAGFAFVPRPVRMRNKQNAVLYYLFFAAHKPVADRIVRAVFHKWAKLQGDVYKD